MTPGAQARYNGGVGRLCYLLAGAGARAVFQAGVLEELYEDERFRNATIFAGTSGGAINAALLAAGKPPQELREFWFRFASEPPIDANTPFFQAVFRVLGDALASDGLGAFSGDALRWAAKRAWRHRGSHPGNLAAFVVEMLLTTNYGLVSRLLNELPEPSLLRGEPVRQLLVSVLGGEQVRTAPGVRLAINAVDIRRCRPARFVNTELPPAAGSRDEYIVSDTIDVDMVLGSAAIPFLLPAVAVGKHRLWDGSLLVNTPLASAISLGADRIVPIMSNAAPDGERELKSTGDALQRLADVIVENCFNLDRKLLLERNKLAHHPQIPGGERYREIELYQAIRPEHGPVFDTGSYLNFSKLRLKDMYEQGRTSAYDWLVRGAKRDALELR